MTQASKLSIFSHKTHLQEQGLLPRTLLLPLLSIDSFFVLNSLRSTVKIQMKEIILFGLIFSLLNLLINRRKYKLITRKCMFTAPIFYLYFISLLFSLFIFQTCFPNDSSSVILIYCQIFSHTFFWFCSSHALLFESII